MVSMSEAASGNGGPAAATAGGGYSGWVPVDTPEGRYFTRREASGKVRVADYPDEIAPQPAAPAGQEAIPFIERVKLQLGRMPSMAPKSEGIFAGDDGIRRAGGPDTTGAEDVRVHLRPPTVREIKDLEKDLDRET